MVLSHRRHLTAMLIVAVFYPPVSAQIDLGGQVQDSGSSTELQTINVNTTANEEERVERQGFSVDSIETWKVKEQNVTLNQVLDRAPGVRVRESRRTIV